MRAALPTFFGKTLLRNSRVLIRSESGACFAVRQRDLGTYLAMINGGYNYPRHVLEVCKRHLPEGGVFFDIGANIGFLTIELAHHFGNGIRIVAVEPQRDLAEAIVISAAITNKTSVTVFDTLIGERNGIAELFLVTNSAHASVKGRGGSTHRVARPIVTLDALIKSQNMPPPTLIKIDVEGAEFSVLKGARQTIQAHQPFLLFEADDNMARFGYTKQDLFSEISGVGEYVFYDVEKTPDGHLAALRKRSGGAESTSDDILAVPARRVVRC